MLIIGLLVAVLGTTTQVGSVATLSSWRERWTLNRQQRPFQRWPRSAEAGRALGAGQMFLREQTSLVWREGGALSAFVNLGPKGSATCQSRCPPLLELELGLGCEQHSSPLMFCKRAVTAGTWRLHTPRQAGPSGVVEWVGGFGGSVLSVVLLEHCFSRVASWLFLCLSVDVGVGVGQ